MAAAAANPPRIAVKLKRKQPSNQHDGPTLVRFPHGPPPQLTHPETAADINFRMYAHTDDRKASNRILTAETGRVTYVAPNYGVQSFKFETSQYAIGVFDTSKSKLKIIPCDHVYRMEQHVAALDSIEAAASKADETFTTQQRVLADTFGSRKRQKQLQSRAANQVTVQESLSQVLTHAVSSIIPNTAVETEEQLLEQIREKVLPPYNELAEHVSDIYPRESLLPAHLHEGMTVAAKRWRAVVKKGPKAVAEQAKDLTPWLFVKNRLLALAERGYDEREAQTLKLIIFMHLLMQFRAGGKNKRKAVSTWSGSEAKKEEGADAAAATPTSQGEGVDDTVKNYFVHTFTSLKTVGDATRSVFDGVSEQKLNCHIAVCSLLLAPNFTLDADQVDFMATDLKIMTTEMLNYYAEAGATVSKVRISLAAPLKLPNMRKKLDRKK